MLHKLKVALSSSADEKSVLKTNQRLADIDTQLCSLTQIASLQQKVEENERAWSVLSYSIRTVGNAFSQAATLDDGADAQKLYNCSNALVVAGENLPNPRLSHANRELRSFCETVRALRMEHTKAVDALRKKCYYAKKVRSLQQARATQNFDGKARETIVLRLNRNENKYEEAVVEVESKTTELEHNLAQAKIRQEKVLAIAMRAFIDLQLQCFRNKSLESVVNHLPEVDGYSDDSSGSSIGTTSGSSYRLHSRSHFDSGFSGAPEGMAPAESEINTFLPHPSMIDQEDDAGFDTADDEDNNTTCPADTKLISNQDNT